MKTSHAQNLKYLQSLVDQIKVVPRELAIRIGFNIYLEMIAVSTNDDAGFDSGQAAANWVIEGYVGGASYQSQKILWGYGDVAPTNPVGYKSWFEGHGGKETNRNMSGNRNAVYEYMFSKGLDQVTIMPNQITGVSVYNPISPGFPGFTPGDDVKYAANALGENQSKLSQSIARGISRGIAEIIARYPKLKG